MLPQLFNPYVSLSIYRLDTNVRLAPIVGLGGGGIRRRPVPETSSGCDTPQAGTTIFLIVVTGAAMDFISAQIRRKLV